VLSTSAPFDHNILLHHFRLTAPALNYRYRLFSIGHDVSDIYPVHFLGNDDLLHQIATLDNPAEQHTRYPKTLTMVASDEPHFVALLRRVFGADQTRRLIASLLAHSQGAKVRTESQTSSLDGIPDDASDRGPPGMGMDDGPAPLKINQGDGPPTEDLLFGIGDWNTGE
jgi:hypothetical protein